MAEQWLTIVEYARNFAISDMTVRRRIKTGKLQAVLKDGKYFIPISQLSDSQRRLLKSDSLVHYPANSGTSNDEGKSIYPQADSSRRDLVRLKPQNQESSYQHLNSMSPHSPSYGFAPKDNISPPNPNDSLVKYYEHSLDLLQKETRLRYEAELMGQKTKIEKLESDLNYYKQQVEDLQLLVKMFENRSQ